MNRIPVSDLSFYGNEEKYVIDAVQSGWVSSTGKYVQKFELDFAEYIGVDYSVAVANGTCALHLALVALDVGRGDEVIVPSFTFAASVNAILHAGATPVLVDSLSDHWSMDTSLVADAITSKTKAIMAVHLFGHPCDMETILQLADKHNLYVIEDAAEAHGATCLDRKVGSLGDIGCFSFYANKIITSGEGGMCVTKSQSLAKKLKVLRDHGMNPKKAYWHDYVGYNYRLTNLNAALGVAQLENINLLLNKRRAIFLQYNNRFIKNSLINFSSVVPYGSSVPWLPPVFFTENINRDTILKAMKEKGVDVRPTFNPIHIMPPYKELPRFGSMQYAEYYAMHGLILPCFPKLVSTQVDYISDCLIEIVNNMVK